MIKYIRTLLAGFVLAGLAGLSCGGQKQAESEPSPESLLIAADFPGLERVSEVRVFVGDSLWEYINGGAELYHSYNFVEVATADYTFSEAELVADIYLFDTDDNAFGLYSHLRPDIPNSVSLGAGGFISATNLIFLKGRYVIMLTGFDDSPQTAQGISVAAAMLDNIVPGKTEPPEMLAQLPAENEIPYSEKMYAESFLGQSALSQVYTRRYALGNDTLTLFLTTDTGEKFTGWQEQLAGELQAVDLDLSAADQKQLISSVHGYYGQIVALGKSGYLAGVVGYTDQHRDFVSTWLKSIGG